MDIFYFSELKNLKSVLNKVLVFTTNKFNNKKQLLSCFLLFFNDFIYL